MRAGLWVSLFLSLSAFEAMPASAQPAAVEVSIVEIDPPSGDTLAPGKPLSARVRYKSNVPVRFRMEGRWHDKVAPASMLNPAPRYPAGEGEAIAWIAYRQATSIDEIAIKALDESWRPLAVASTAALMEWREGSPRREQARWVADLNGAQQDMTARALQSTDPSSGWGVDLFMLLPAAVLAYFFLQPWTIKRFDGGWRIAAFAPLVATVPLVLHALVALMAGSNLWPLLLIFCLPFATLYLLALTGARAVVRAA